MLDDVDVDAICNPLPNGLHLCRTIKALHNGKHVLCWTPLAANAADARAMEKAARVSGHGRCGDGHQPG